MEAMMAEVLYPAHSEIGTSKIGVWVSGAGSVTGTQRKKLQELLPPYADVRYRLGTFRIEMDVPREQRGKDAIHRLAKLIRSAISKGLRVKAGLCPVASSARVLDLTRRG